MSDLKVPTKIESDRPGAAQHQPKSGSYPVVGKPDVGFGGPMMGAMRSLM
jgi:hypothetical protein